MGEFDKETRRAADRDVVKKKDALLKAISTGDVKKIADAKEDLNRAFRLRKRVNKPGPGSDASRGGGPQQSLGPPGPRG